MAERKAMIDRNNELPICRQVGIPVDRDRSFWFVVTVDSGLS